MRGDDRQQATLFSYLAPRCVCPGITRCEPCARHDIEEFGDGLDVHFRGGSVQVGQDAKSGGGAYFLCVAIDEKMRKLRELSREEEAWSTTL